MADEKDTKAAAAAAADKEARQEAVAADANIVVSGGIRYTKKDADARGLKPDTAAHAKKIANNEVPVGTYVGTNAGDAEAIPAPLTTAADKK